MAISNVSRRILFASTTLASTLAPVGTILAQTASGASSDLNLEEIVITSQKRTEKLSDVTVSAAVVGPSTLENANVSSISDLNKLVPSVSIAGTTNSRAPMGIRGISSISNQAAVGIVSGVSVLIDGVPISSDSFAMKHLDDVQRIEVLKGPQSTLGGRSAAQGVINIVRREPSDTWTGALGATITDDQEKRLNAFVAGPILPGSLDFSLAAYGNRTPLPIDNVYPGAADIASNTYGAHGKLLFKPSDDLSLLLSLGLAHDNFHGINLTYTYITPGVALGGPPPAPIFSQAVLLPGIKASFENEIQNTPVRAGSSAIDKDAALNVDYKIGEYTLSSTTAWQGSKQDSVNDLFTVAVYFAPPFDNTQRIDKDVKQVSEEVKFVSPADLPFNYVVGAYYARTIADESTYRNLTANPVIFSVDSVTTTSDLYARTTWKFLANTSLVTGVRYNYDEISYDLAQVKNGAANGLHHSAGSNNLSTVVGDLSLKQQLTDDWMVYATSALGYSPRAYNTAGSLANDNPMKPAEKTKIYHNEIGSKGAYFNRRLSLNVSIFDTFYRDYQVQTFEVSGTTATPKIDKGDARTTGIEVDTAFKATSNLQLSLNAAYINARFTNYKNAPCYAFPRGSVAAGCHLEPTLNNQSVWDITGKVMPNAPRLKVTVGAEQRVPVGAYDLVFNGTYSYQGETQMLPDENPQALQSSFGLVNLSTTLAQQSGKYSVTLFCNNVLDHHYTVFALDSWGPVYGGNVVASQPARDSNRYFGLRFNASF